MRCVTAPGRMSTWGRRGLCIHWSRAPALQRPHLSQEHQENVAEVTRGLRLWKQKWVLGLVLLGSSRARSLSPRHEAAGAPAFLHTETTR